MAQRAHSKKGSSANASFTAADSKRQLQSILAIGNNNKDRNKRQQLLSEKENLKEKKNKLNAMKRNKSRSNKLKKKDNKIVREQQKISAEWMKISKEKDLLEKQSLILKKEKLKLLKLQKESKIIKPIINEEEMVLTPTNNNTLNDITTEQIKLQKQQKAAKQAQKRAEKTLSDLYRKKQELKKEELLIQSERKKFKRLEAEYNEFKREKQRFKSEQKSRRKKEKYLEVNREKKTRLQLLQHTNIQKEKDRIKKTKNVLKHHQSIYSHPRTSTKNIGLILSEQKEYKELKKKVNMYQDQIEFIQNKNKILKRKLAKHNKFANDYAQDLELNKADNNKTKYLISMLRAKLIELQNRNKLLSKLIKRHKNVTDAYSNINDLKMARKLITKLVTQNEDLNKKMNGINQKMQKMKDLGEKYQTQLYKMYDDDDDDDNDDDNEVEFTQILYQSMKQKIAELTIQNEELDDILQEKETQLLQFASYANEWDVKHRLGQDREKALYSKLRIEIDESQNKLDLVYSELEKEKAAASTWQNTIEDRLKESDTIEVGDDEKLLLINQLKEENKKLMTIVGFNKEEDIKRHKAIAMDLNEQFGTGLFNNLQYILIDADLNNDDVLKLKIKDKNDEIYKVVLIKQSDEENEIVKPIVFEQKNMVQTLEGISSVMDRYNNRISRIVDMLAHIKNSRKILKWNAISNETKKMKPKFDLVVSELRQISVPSSSHSRHHIVSPTENNYRRHQQTMMKFIKTNHRTESIESLDSIYDLSGDDNLTKFGIGDIKSPHHTTNSVNISSRISQFNRVTSPPTLFYPNQHGTREREEKGKQDLSDKLAQDDVGHIFDYYDKDNNGTISVAELIEVFKQLGVDVSDETKIKSIISSLDIDDNGIVTRDNFISWWFSDSASAVQMHFDSGVRSLLYLYAMGFEGRKTDELHAFAQYLNAIFSENENRTKITHGLDGYLPIDVGDGGRDLLSKCVDGVLLSKMINFVVPNTIDERVLHLRDRRSDNIEPKQIVENLNIVLSSCKAIGVKLNMSQVSVERFLNPTYYEDIIRQILSELSLINLSKRINLKDNPVLIRLAAVYEEDQDIKSLNSDVWLKRWINYQLKRSGEDIKIKNFGRDFRHGNVLCHVMQSVTKRKKRKHERFDINEAMSQPPYARPQYVLKVLKEKFNLDIFLSANDILIGNERLICILCAQIFSKWKGMRKITKEEEKHVNDIFSEDENYETQINYTSTVNIEKEEDDHQREVRIENDITNWMNEIFCASNSSNLKLSNLCRDLRDGLVLLKFMDLMAPNIVDWKCVNKNKDVSGLSRQQCLTNCHYIISLIKNEPFCSSFFGIEQLPSDAGNDIYCSNKAIIFKICYNLINYHYMVILTQLLGYKATSYDLIHFCNTELKKRLKYPRFCSFDERSLHHFSDSSLKSSLYYIDLLLMLSDDPRNDINRDIVIHKNNRRFTNDDYTKSECLSNARYALSIARKFGGIFYISPYDLVEVRMPEITMSFVMCIVLLILNKNQQNKKKEDESNDVQIRITQNDEKDKDELEETENENKQRIAAKHGRKRSVLEEYGIITDIDQLEELQIISRQYSKQNNITPRTPTLPE